MTEQEVNRKLLEWAGLEWKWNHNPDCPCGAIDDDNRRSWYSKDGALATRFEHEQLDFTHSLDACFKWLVPKLTGIFLSRTVDGKEWHCLAMIKNLSSVADANTPALALCLAILPLIEMGEPKFKAITDIPKWTKGSLMPDMDTK